MKKAMVVIGAQWGDEGKGKIVDFLSQKADIVVRFNGGNNAGHTVVWQDEVFPLSQLPSGVLWGRRLLIAQGCVVNPKVLLSEIDFFRQRKIKVDLGIDFRTNLVLPYHQWLDEATEEAKGEKKVGSLKLGIGYCYEDRNNRQGIRLEDFLHPKIFREKLKEGYFLKKKRLLGVFGFRVKKTFSEIYEEYLSFGERLKPFFADVSQEVCQNLSQKNILFEGAHGTFLDAHFGTYPYTTAVNTLSGSVFSAVGFPPQKLEVLGVVKAYTTRVGGGPFPAELFDRVGEKLQEKGQEFGTVSKRKRRCGWLDLPMLRLAQRLNGFSALAITKLDVLTGIAPLKMVDYYLLGKKKLSEFPVWSQEVSRVKPIFKTFPGWTEDISSLTSFSALPRNCRNFLLALEKNLGIPVKYISVGRERRAMIVR